MKCKIPEISWHNRDPVLSVDIQPNVELSNSYRLATGGTDTHVLIWNLNLTDGGSEINLDVAADLTRHQRAVNAVKWSPNGEFLASGDDESVVFIWKQKSESEPINILDNYSEQDKEIWITLKILRGHMEDVYDLSWSPNSQFLVSGSVDNTAIIWDVQKGKSLSILNDHKGFVQGVAWDPKNQYIATLSTDRYLRIFDIQTKKVLHRVNKGNLPVPESNELYGKRMRLFHDDTLQTFFRRLCFTPDGKLLITPAGVTDYDGVAHPMNTSYIFSRFALKQPAIVLPCPDQYTVAIKCCPILFKLRPYNKETNPPVIPLPYRMIFAIATKSSVYLYDTQQKVPFGLISNIHYTRLTDITWSNDGRIIIVSSTDGFCSLITFESNELGEEYEDSLSVLSNGIEENAQKEKKKQKKDNDAQQKEKEVQTPTRRVNEKNSIETNVESAVSATKDLVKNSSNIENSIEPDSNLIIHKASSKIEQENSKNSEKSSKKDDVSNTLTHSSNDQKTSLVTKTDNLNTTKSPGNANVENIKSLLKKDTHKQDGLPKPIIPISDKINQGRSSIASLICESLGNEIILDKKIISSEEKFDSPEKQSRPATPIMVRRHPRKPSVNSPAILSPSVVLTPTSAKEFDARVQAVLNDTSPLSSINKTEQPGVIPSNSKKANPIAIRRQPRALIGTPVEKTAIVEEAMDAWPLDDVKTTSSFLKSVEKKSEINSEEKTTEVSSVPDTDVASAEQTEDIRLVYEDTVEGLLLSPPAGNKDSCVESNANVEEKMEVD